MVTTPYYTGQDFGPREDMAYTAVMPEEGMRYVYDQQGTRHSVPTTFNISSSGGYTSLYKDDPIAEELAAGIQGTDVYQGSPYALANVPEFEGVRYATPNYKRYEDLYNLYMGGGFDAAQDDFVTPPADTTPVDTGGGGGVNIVDTPFDVNTPFEQNLLDEGVGVQGAPGDPVVAPGEMPVTQEEMDAFNQIPVTPVNEFPTGDASLAEKIAAEDRAAKALADEQALTNLEQARTGQYDAPTETYADTGDPDLLDLAGAGIDDVYGTDYGFGTEEDFVQNEDLIDRGNPLNDPRIQPEEFGLVPDPEYTDQIMDPNLMDIRQQQAQEGLTTEQSNTLQNIIGQAGQTVKGAMNQLSKIPGAVADFANQTVDIFGKKFNVGKTLLSAGINKLAGGPISLVFDVLGAILPEGGRSEMSDKLGEQYGMDDIGRLTGGPMAGYAVDSTFGKGIEQSTADVKNDVGNTLSGKYGFTQSELDQIAEGTYTGTKGYNEIMGTTTNLVDRYKELSDMEKQIQRNKTAIDYDMEGTDEGDRAAEEEARAEAEAMEAARQAEIDRQNREADLRAAEAARATEAARAAQAARDRAAAEAAARARDRHGGNGGNQGTGAGAGGGSQQATSGGGFSSGWGGGWGWSKGGIVSLKNGKR